MLPRERVINALERRSVNELPVRIYASTGGLYEHGDKLLSLIRRCGHDFSDLTEVTLSPGPSSEDFDKNGHYYSVWTDEWGVKWESRIYGIIGHALKCPLADISKLENYNTPTLQQFSDSEFKCQKEKVRRHKQRYYSLFPVGGFLERLYSLRGFEDTLVDILTDTIQINKLADMVVEHSIGNVQRAITLDVNAVAFGDDFGTQTAMLFSLEIWRKFFKPRYQKLFEPVIKAGKKIFFHSCGYIYDLLPEFCELGIDVIWPQLTAYRLPELARRVNELGLTIELHPDRGDLMQNASPLEVKDYVLRLCDTFNVKSGGAWLYIEIDPGFPWPNVESLLQTAAELRRS